MSDETEPKHRYVIGETYPFIAMVFDSRDPNSWAMPPYTPWRHTNLEIKVIMLTCLERHAVGWDQDPHGEKKYTGFVFADPDGWHWYNQYPSASYGQGDDSANWRVDPAVKQEGETFVAPFAGTRFSYVEHLVGFTDAIKTASKIEGALRRDQRAVAEGTERYLDDDKRPQFLAFQQQVAEAIEAATGRRLIYEDLTVTIHGERLTFWVMPQARLVEREESHAEG